MPRSIMALCVCTIIATAIRADDEQQLFDSLYQQRLEAARRSAGREDDLELAKQLVAAAKESANNIKFVELACNHAYELTRGNPDGYAVAASAMELLADTAKSRRADAREKQVEMLTKLSRTGKPTDRIQDGKALFTALLKMGEERAESGDYPEAIRVYRQARSLPGRDPLLTESIDWSIAVSTHRQRAAAQIAKLREKLLADATDHMSADTLIRLHLIDMDAPHLAIKFISQAGEKEIKAIAETAAKPSGELSKEEAKALGQWYANQANTAPASIDTYMLRKASEYLALYLQLHGDTDLTGKAMALQLKEIRKRYRESAPLTVKTLVDLPAKTIHTWEDQGIERRVTINKVKLINSLQTHPSNGRPAHVEFQLEGKYVTFQGAVGVNDHSTGPLSDLTFVIVADGKELWRSTPTRRKNVVQVFQVNVESVGKLELKVSCSGSDHYCAAAWVEPLLYSKAIPAVTNKKEFAGIPTDEKSR